MLNHIETTRKADLVRCEAELHDLLKGIKLWKSASSPDAFVRRSFYRLLTTLMADWRDELDPSLISASVLTSCLNIDQTGSSSDYAKILADLSADMPSVWTLNYHGTGKKSARNRLCQYLRKGSQSGSIAYWTHLGEAMRLLPVTLFTTADRAEKDTQKSLDVLDTLHEGIISKDESRTNTCAAWQVYLLTSNRVYAAAQGNEQTKVLESYVCPLVAQYIRPSLERSGWTVIGPESELICAEACSQVLDHDYKLFIRKWQDLSSQLIETLKTSLPEQSKDHTKSQDSLVVEASRWYSLQSTLLQGDTPAIFREVAMSTLDQEVEAMISILNNRNGKPYGAAGALDKVIQLFPQVILASDALKTQLYTFANEDLPRLMLSPSAGYLVHVLDLLQWTCDVRQGFSKATQTVAEALQSPQRTTALRALLSSPALANNEVLADIATESLDQALDRDDRGDWDAVVAAIVNPEAPKGLIARMLATLVETLSIDERLDSALYGLECLKRRGIQSMQEYSATSEGSALIEKLLFLADSADDTVAQRALNLSNNLQSRSTHDENSLGYSAPGLVIIQRSFEEVTTESLS